MFITYDTLLQYPELKGVKILAGKAGLTRLIQGAHFIDLPDPWNWINTNELLFLSGISIQEPETDLLEIVERCARKNMAGLVLAPGPYLESVPTAVCERCDELEIPLLSIPWESHINDIEYHIYHDIFRRHEISQSINTFLHKMIATKEPRSFEKDLILLGYQPQNPHVILDCKIRHIISQNANTADCIEQNARLLSNIMAASFERFQIPNLFMTEADRILCIIDLGNENKLYRQAISQIQSSLDAFAARQATCIAYAGISNIYDSYSQIRQALEESTQALIIAQVNQKANSCQQFQSIGAYQLFFSLSDEQLESIMDSTLSPLLDDPGGTEMLDTLEAYLDHDCHIRNTATDLYIHWNTLKYRINKISDLLHCDLSDSHTLFNLRMAFSIRRYLTWRKENP
ncbi:MAG: PucR family transcriptional regulator ligand-binding domain-containing protein [Clostridiales bacterium]|nr:PucR family transcriptional regulator ligand-binding domain-containing protein [Clostridiales bacterium]